MASTDPGVRMPVVGRSSVHEEGLALIGEWIESMESYETDTNRSQAEAVGLNQESKDSSTVSR
jgi:hypothetical protein